MPKGRHVNTQQPPGSQFQDGSRPYLVTVFLMRQAISFLPASREQKAEVFRVAMRNCFVFVVLPCQSKREHHATYERPK
jgi:hypothetical protein